MDQHTPGPWHMDTAALPAIQGGAIVRGAAGYRIAETFSGTVGGGQRDAEANARLIAAAPDLLAALRRMVMLVNGTSATDEEPYREACAAIAKAEGRPSLRVSAVADLRCHRGRSAGRHRHREGAVTAPSREEAAALALWQWCWARFMNLYGGDVPVRSMSEAPPDPPAVHHVADALAAARQAGAEEERQKQRQALVAAAAEDLTPDFQAKVADLHPSDAAQMGYSLAIMLWTRTLPTSPAKEGER